VAPLQSPAQLQPEGIPDAAIAIEDVVYQRKVCMGGDGGYFIPLVLKIKNGEKHMLNVLGLSLIGYNLCLSVLKSDLIQLYQQK